MPVGPRFSSPSVTSERSVHHRDKRKAWCVSLRADTIRDNYLTIFFRGHKPNWYNLQTYQYLTLAIERLEAPCASFDADLALLMSAVLQVQQPKTTST